MRNMRKTRVYAALSLVIIAELGLFAESHYQRWQRVIRPLRQPAKSVGEGLVIRGNGLGYYAWLRSLLIDHDWNFDNEFDEHALSGDYVPPCSYRTDLGFRANQWSVGPACVWALVLIPGHCVLTSLGQWSPWAVDGYSLPYQLLVGGASLATSSVCLAFLYCVCARYARPGRAALAATFLTLGSTVVYYEAIEVSMAHGIGAACLAALVWYWLKGYGSMRWSRWLTVGLLVGVAALVRWQLATFGLLPVGEGLMTGWRTREDLGKRIAGMALAGAGALAAFSPQMVAWRCVYGHWLVEPVPHVAPHWLRPSLWSVLLSQDRSLFYWTPICAVACFGYFLCRPSARAGPATLLFVAFALQVYVLASLWGKGEYLENTGNFAGAFLSKAYGMRHLTEAVVVLAPGLAILLERASRICFRLLWGLGFVLTMANLALVGEYTNGVLPLDDGANPGTLLASTVRFVESDPMIFFALFEALGLICLILLWGREEPALEAGEGGQEHVQAPSRPASTPQTTLCTKKFDTPGGKGAL